MPQSLSAVYIHLTFSTKERRPFLRDNSTREALPTATTPPPQPIVPCNRESPAAPETTTPASRPRPIPPAPRAGLCAQQAANARQCHLYGVPRFFWEPVTSLMRPVLVKTPSESVS